MSTAILITISFILSVVVTAILAIVTGNISPVTLVGPALVIATIMRFVCNTAIVFICPTIAFVAMCIFGIVMANLND